MTGRDQFSKDLFGHGAFGHRSGDPRFWSRGSRSLVTGNDTITDDIADGSAAHLDLLRDTAADGTSDIGTDITAMSGADPSPILAPTDV